jgi:hypothetical protein
MRKASGSNKGNATKMTVTSSARFQRGIISVFSGWNL